MDDEVEKDRIDGLSEYELKKIIEKNTYPKWKNMRLMF